VDPLPKRRTFPSFSSRSSFPALSPQYENFFPPFFFLRTTSLSVVTSLLEGYYFSRCRRVALSLADVFFLLVGTFFPRFFQEWIWRLVVVFSPPRPDRLYRMGFPFPTNFLFADRPPFRSFFSHHSPHFPVRPSLFFEAQYGSLCGFVFGVDVFLFSFADAHPVFSPRSTRNSLF